jgi:hypothetical protein
MRYENIKNRIPPGNFFLGLFIGIVLALPLATNWLGNVIPESAGNFWGAALGAAIAVLGALSVEKIRRRESQKQVAEWAHHFSYDVIYCLQRLNELHGPAPQKQGPRSDDSNNRPLAPDEWAAVREAVDALVEARSRFDKNAKRLSPFLINFDIDGIRAFYGLEYILDNACAVAQQISQQSMRGGERSMQQRIKLSAWSKNAELFEKTMLRLSGQTESV